MKKFGAAIFVGVPASILMACGPTQPIGTGGSGGGGTGGTGGTNPFCAVQTILQQRCQSCHTNPPIGGAPDPFVTYADTQKTSVENPLATVWQMMKTKLDGGLMPPTGYTQLSTDEKTTLENWFAAGAPGADCAADGGTSGSGGWAGFGGQGPLPCTVTRSFKAHASGNLNAKYAVAPGTTNQYNCYTFKNPFTSDEIITASRPAADNLNVIHHFLLFGVNGGTDGAVQAGGCYTPQVNGQQLDGWAPGGGNTIFPDDIGAQITTPYVTLQIHYNTVTGGDDASGMEYCTTTKPRTNIAKCVTLGTDNISIPAGAVDATASGTCTGLPTTSSPVYVIVTSPHMHLLGSGFTTQVVGTSDLLSNIPLGTWSFEAQRHYRIDRYKLNPGQQLVTTCHYKNDSSHPVNFGPATTDEMCYDFLFVYPASGSKTECGQGITFTGN